MTLPFEPVWRFPGLPRKGFDVFTVKPRALRRREIVDNFHPGLKLLGEDLIERLDPGAAAPLHAHIPRLDWPRDYEPFCTWLALSRKPQGYQDGPQLNLGVHADHVAARLGWDTQSDAFGRFEFLVRRAHLGEQFAELAAEHGLHIRVYAAAPWPQGSRCVFESQDDSDRSFDEVRARGVWWELGLRWDLPAEIDFVTSREMARATHRVFRALLPLYDRLAGHPA